MHDHALRWRRPLRRPGGRPRAVVFGWALWVAAAGLPGAAQTASPENPAVVRISASGRSGTGFLVRPDGLILTAAHVVLGAKGLYVHFTNGVSCPVTRAFTGLVRQDVAAVQIDPASIAKGIAPIKLASAAPLARGTTLTAIGYGPSDRQKPVSGKLFTPQGRSGCLQFGAATLHGFSGGPALNDRGEAVGVVIGGYMPGLTLSVAAALPGPSIIEAIVREPAGRPAGVDADVEIAERHAAVRAVVEFWRDRAVTQDDEAGRLDAYRWASGELRQIVDRWPNVAEVRMLLVGCLRHAQHPRDADRELRAALDLDPENLMARCALAIVGYKVSDVQVRARAILIARDAPDFAGSHMILGIAALRRGNTEEAIFQLRWAVDLDPDGAEPHQELAGVYRGASRWAEAVEEYRKAILADPESASAHYGLGACSLRLNNRAQARQELTTLERMNGKLARQLAAKLKAKPK